MKYLMTKQRKRKISRVTARIKISRVMGMIKISRVMGRIKIQISRRKKKKTLIHRKINMLREK